MSNNILNEINNYTQIGKSKIKFINKAYHHFSLLNKPIKILETGCGHHPNSNIFASMTYVFSKIISQYHGSSLLTIDLDEKHLNECKEITKEFSNIIDYKLGDSLDILKNLDEDYVKSIDLIILDSYDLYLFDPIKSGIHHLKELLSLYENLNENCLIAIDDNYLPGTWIQWNWDNGKKEIFETKDKLIGKGMFCDDFLIKNNWIRDDSVVYSGENNVFLYKYKSHF
jgi:SAM-dependent methyltransferase